jgi:hypothetical protein
MIDLINQLNKPETDNYIFHIAGFGTEKLNQRISLPGRFVIHGTVDKTKLHELYKNVDAVILNQKPSSGALTKISELLTANIPVVANKNAARNYFNVPGIQIFRDDKELLTFLEHPLDFKFSDNIHDVNLEIIKQEIRILLGKS